MALNDPLVDPVSFTTIRLVSCAVALVVIARIVAGRESQQNTKASWDSGFALFAYAAAFSLAYVSLSAGMGALILFGTVQVTMLGAALALGKSLGPAQWVDSVTATGGLVYLVLPGISAPDPLGTLLMCVSGITWGRVYSIRGKGVSTPVAMPAGNFHRSALFAIAASAIALSRVHLKPSGILLALTAGMVTSGMGYVLWYRVLRSLTTAQASIVQPSVPVLAAFGGVAFLSENVSTRLVAASALILGGGALGVLKGQTTPNRATRTA
jgi:drug/metabolite transporter (DMT)-like permease